MPQSFSCGNVFKQVGIKPFQMSMTSQSVSSVKSYYCYVIYSGNRTYAGYTVDLQRRLRQHNQEIKGGARSTSSLSNWKYLLVMASPVWDARRAMQVEYLHKHPTRTAVRPGKFSKPIGRIKALSEICKWIEEPVTVYVCPNYYQFCEQDLILTDNIIIKQLNDTLKTIK